jgi:uncharacterized protein YutE (UPF0331/DUF86 family)
MTPRSLDPLTIQARLHEIRLLIDDLRDLGQVDADQLRSNRQRRHIVERVLAQIVDLAAAINAHITAVESDRAPDSYGRSFNEIATVGVIDRDLAGALVPSVGMRNALIHDYLEINHERVAAAVPLAIDQYGHYVEQVSAWLVKRMEAQNRSGGR